MQCLAAEASSSFAPAQATAAFRLARVALRYAPNATPFAVAACIEAEGRHLLAHRNPRQGYATLAEARDRYVRMLGNDAPRVRDLANAAARPPQR